MKRQITRLFFALLTTAVLFGGGQACLGQKAEREVVDEIEVAPSGERGEWTVGGLKIISDGKTDFVSRNPAETGALARVKFEIRDGQAVALEFEPIGILASEAVDGPHVLWKDATSAEIVAFADGQMTRTVFENIDSPRIVAGLAGPESSIVLDPTLPVTPKSEWDMPSRLLAISDLEGNYDSTLRFLKNNQVLDDEGHWNWGDGHLVFLGDLVDRGAMVTELMWLVRRLEREAAAAGGCVHYVLGNHEAMVMAGDLRYLHPKYLFVTRKMGISYDQLYATDSDIGRWWRSKNAIERIGDLLFVHGGYSPKLDEFGLDMDTLNQRVRGAIHPGKVLDLSSPATSPVKHQHGPLWYRGYFNQFAEDLGGKATSEEVQKILDRHNAKHMIIGHTVVDQVGPIYDAGKVIAIDVKWKDSKKGEGLLVENGKFWRLTMTAGREELDFSK